ncbi:MAG: MocR-like pyridoxine biosynthesis transcription factor PdxR [Candidatus Limnocylindrales bacterium]
MAIASNVTLDAASGRDILLEMELRRGTLRRNLRCALREAIQDGRLGAGTRLPSSRRLATDLQVSRGVVADTYDQLAAEGYLAVRPRQAPVVIDIAEATVEEAVPTPATDGRRTAWPIDFIATAPDLELFPRRAWLRAMERVIRDIPNEALDYGDHRGRIELRTALREYLVRVRGVRTSVDRIVITGGFTQALDLLSRVLRDRGATSIGFETPSSDNAWPTVRAAGLRIEPIAIDADGLRVDQLARCDAAAIVVTPAHQFPTGAVMTPARRADLVAWANARPGRLIIEDDYDAEFRYDRNAIGAIQGLDPTRVVHVGTASKTFAPGLRLGWMSVPADLIDAVTAAKAIADSGSPSLEQLALADLLASGEYDRHIARARQSYRHRRDRLIAALDRWLPTLPIEGVAAGLHVLIRLPDDVDDVAVAAAAAERGIGVRPLSPMSLDDEACQGLLLGYGRLTPERIDDAVAALAASLTAAGLAPIEASDRQASSS